MPDRDTMADGVLATTIAAVGADTAVLTALGGAGGMWTWPAGYLTGAQAATFEDIHRREPWPLAIHTRDGSGEAMRISDLLTGSQFRRSEMYSGLYRELGIRHQVAFALAAGDAELCVALQRQGRDFSDSERERLSALRRPLAVALRGWTVAAPVPRAGTLTAREEEVLALAARGLGDRQIARRLGVRPATVSKHLQHVYRKTGTANRTHAAAVSAR